MSKVDCPSWGYIPESALGVSEVFLASHPKLCEQRSLLQAPSASPPPFQSFHTSSRVRRFNLDSLHPSGESPAPSNVPTLDPGSSTTSPTSTSRGPLTTPYTPLSKTQTRLSAIPDGTMMRFFAFDEQEHSQLQDHQQGAGYIDNWLHQASFDAVSPFQPPSLCRASPLAPVCEFAASGRETIQEQYICQSPSSTIDSPKNSMSDFFYGGADIKLFHHHSPDLHFDLEGTVPMGVFESVAGIQTPLISTSSIAPQVLGQDAQDVGTKEGLSCDPLYDETPEDENILRRNMRDPWPYDQRRLVPAHLQSTSISAAAPDSDTFTRLPARLSSLLRLKRKRACKPPSQAHQPSVSRTTTSKVASCFGLNFSYSIGSTSFQFSSMKASKNKHVVGTRGRIPNSMVPHPEWGTFPFRSDSDSLASDDSDGDIHTWLQRVVRRNTRIGLESLKIAGHDRPMTIEEYDKHGSWLHGHDREWAAIADEYGEQRGESTHWSSSSSYTSSSLGDHFEGICRNSLYDDRAAPPEYDCEAGSSFGADSFYASNFNSNTTTDHSLSASKFPALPNLRSSQPQVVKNGFIHGSLSTHGHLSMSASISSTGRTLGKAACKTFGPFVRRAVGTVSASYAMVSTSRIRHSSARRTNATVVAEVAYGEEGPLGSSMHALAGHRLPGIQDSPQANFEAHLPVTGKFTPAFEVEPHVRHCKRGDDDLHLFDFGPMTGVPAADPNGHHRGG